MTAKDTKSERPVPHTRVVRGGAIAKVAVTQSALLAGTKIANTFRDTDAAHDATSRRQLQAMNRIVRVLGSMRGASMKLGQMLSVLEFDFLPQPERERFQATITGLCDQAPRVSLETLRSMIEGELGPIATTFAQFDPQPCAAASIGQVFRAVLPSGERVAVKVQYPKIANAVRADMKNLRMLSGIGRQILPDLDLNAIIDEVQERVTEELDYAQEARNQELLAERFDGHPFIHIPRTFPNLCTGKVLVTEWVDGQTMNELRQAPEDMRDRAGEIIFRFYTGNIYRYRQFSGDPNPGNCLYRADGTVSFLDFGHFKVMEQAAADFEIACLRAIAESRSDDLHALMVAAGILTSPELITPNELLAIMHPLVAWYLTPGENRLSGTSATATLMSTVDPGSGYFDVLRHQSLPKEHLLSRRAEAFIYALLGYIGAQADWNLIVREWLYSDAPMTELGRQEAQWLLQRTMTA